jgi:hypothetical protein
VAHAGTWCSLVEVQLRRRCPVATPGGYYPVGAGNCAECAQEGPVMTTYNEFDAIPFASNEELDAFGGIGAFRIATHTQELTDLDPEFGYDPYLELGEPESDVLGTYAEPEPYVADVDTARLLRGAKQGIVSASDPVAAVSALLDQFVTISQEATLDLSDEQHQKGWRGLRNRLVAEADNADLQGLGAILAKAHWLANNRRVTGDWALATVDLKQALYELIVPPTSLTGQGELLDAEATLPNPKASRRRKARNNAVKGVQAGAAKSSPRKRGRSNRNRVRKAS